MVRLFRRITRERYVVALATLSAIIGAAQVCVGVVVILSRLAR
jgi:hypothetical protein